MSASQIINKLPKLTKTERQAVFNKLRELAQRDEDVRAGHAVAKVHSAALGRLEEPAAAYRIVELRGRGIGESEAADMRAAVSRGLGSVEGLPEIVQRIQRVQIEN